MKKNSAIILLSLLSLVASCKVSFTSLPTETEIAAPTTTPPTIDPDLFTSSVLSNESYSAGAHTYQLIKSQSGSKTPTYMQWIPNDTNTTSGAVIIYYPYESINWSGEAVDAKWSALPSGGQPDDDGPYYNVSTSSQIANSPMPHLTAAENASLFNTNRLHTLIVYGRYYSGTTVAGDVQAVLDGYRFLNSKSVVDKTKIGIYSGSWGGVGVLYGSKAAAAYNLKPKTISLSYPVSDLKALSAYIDSIPTLTADATKRIQYAAFFDPYKRRLDKATEALAGQSTRYDKYSRAELASLDASLFVIHDDWDTLVPVGLTSNLFTSMTLSDKYSYFQRHITGINYDTFILNHSQASQQVDYATTLTWNYHFLVTELTDPTQTRITSFARSIYASQFQHMKIMFDNGADTSHFRKTLGLLCRPNVQMLDVESGNFYSGSDVFVFLMNVYYGVSWAADGPAACAKLISNPPF